MFQLYLYPILLSLVICMVDGYDNNIKKPNPGDTFANCINERNADEIECEEIDDVYRTFDGHCNNLNNTLWGATFTSYNRLLDPVYSDERKVDLPRGFLHAPFFGDRSPPANQISSIIFNVEQENKGNSQHLSSMFMTFGQFLDHDMSLTPQGHCLVQSCNQEESWKYPCFPILFKDGGDTCTRFGRSVPVCQNSNKLEDRKPRQQMNILSSFIDGSQIYGASFEASQLLRKLDDTGELLMSEKGLLPIDESRKDTCFVQGGCSLVGDVRGDATLPLNTLHTLWLREHNRIAKEFKVINPHWDGEEIYQETRKIIGGVLQRIVYREYVPLIARLYRYKGYSKSTNPSIFNGFNTAAFRYGHSLIPEYFSQLDSNFDVKFEPKKLQEVFFNREPANEFGIEPTMFGMLGNESNSVDTGFCQSVGKKLFIFPGGSGIADLAAFNIQRGRDHGLPMYGKWREYCGLEKISDWKHLQQFMSNGAVSAFEKLYKSPDDIDLYAAGVAENHVQYTSKSGRNKTLAVGPTFECIFRQQFSALRDGDRFFYRHEGVFTSKQLQEINKVRLASVLCANLKGIVSVQPKAFFSASYQNRVICNGIPRLNLEAWKEIESTDGEHGAEQEMKAKEHEGDIAFQNHIANAGEVNDIEDELDELFENL